MNYTGVFRKDLFAGQNIVVTGGGSGIGRAIALELAQLGARVGLIGRELEKLQRVQQEIENLGGQVAIAAADIRDVIQVQTAIQSFIDKFSVLHGLVNNAGGQYFSPLEKITNNGFDAVIRTNLYGTFHLMKTLFDTGMHRDGGCIVNMLADMWDGMPMMAHSGAARAGVYNLTKTAAFEWAKYGIRVNAVAPGYIDSSGLDQYDAEAKKWIPKIKTSVPLQRLGTEAEVSAAVVYLLSPAAHYITGETLCVDGGSHVSGTPWPPPPLSGPTTMTEPFFSFEEERV